MQGIHSFNCGLGQVDIHGLGLTDKRSSVGGHVQYMLLFDLPDRLVQVFDPRRNGWNILNGPTMGNDHVANIIRPEAVCNQIPEHVFVDDGEFSGKYASSIQIGCERLEALVVAQDV